MLKNQSYKASLSKNKSKKLLQEKLLQLNNEYCTKKSINLSKLTTLNKYKKEPKREQYIKSLTRSDASIIFKLRTRTLNLKNNFRNTKKNQIYYGQDATKKLTTTSTYLNDVTNQKIYTESIK